MLKTVVYVLYNIVSIGICENYFYTALDESSQKQKIDGFTIHQKDCQAT